jgi:solute carrier family 45 protein 1/2/4
LALIINIIISLHLSQKPSYPEFSSTKTKPLFSNISITHIWTGAHIFFAITMFSTIFVTSWLGATVLIALTGVSWALTLWAPYSIIGNELTILEVGERGSASRSRTTGSIMGIHNVAIAAPQIVAALLSSFIFWLSQELGSEDGTGWALRAGGVSALFAAYLTSQLKT